MQHDEGNGIGMALGGVALGLVIGGGVLALGLLAFPNESLLYQRGVIAAGVGLGGLLMSIFLLFRQVSFGLIRKASQSVWLWVMLVCAAIFVVGALLAATPFTG